MDSKQLNRADLTGDFVLLDNEEHELWRKRLSATNAFIENMHVDNLSYASLAQDTMSIENISVGVLSTERILADKGKFKKIEVSVVNSISANDSVSSELCLNPTRISLFSGSDTSGNDGILDTYGSFSASVVSDDALIAVSKQTSNKEKFALSVQPTGFAIFNESRLPDEETNKSSYAELRFPAGLSGQYTIATLQDIESKLSNYIEKTDGGNLDLNRISCQGILVSAEAVTEGDGIYHESNITVKTPRSDARLESTTYDNPRNGQDSRVFLSCSGNNGGNSIFYFSNNRYDEYDSEDSGVSGDIGSSYIFAQTNDRYISSDNSFTTKTTTARIDLIANKKNPSISINDGANKSLKIEIPFSDRDGNQIMALRSDLSDYSYSKEDIARIFKDKTDLSDIQATIFDFGRNDISSFDWAGLMTSNMLVDAGLKEPSVFEWKKQPLYVKIGDRISAIGDYAFASCPSLQDIDLADIRHIGKNAFNGCSCIADLHIPDTVSAIGENAFNSCANLGTLMLPPSVQAVGQGAFLNTGLTEIAVEGKTLDQAEDMLGGKIPTGCQVKTWDFQPKGEYVQQSALTGFTTDGDSRNYKIDVNPDGKAYVHVPWQEAGEIPPRYKTYDDTLSSLSNSGYATRKWVQEQGYSTGQQSLDDYATKNWVQDYHQNNPPNNARITITQNNETKGWFTLNQPGDQTIKLDGGSGGGGVPPEEYKTYDDTLSSLSNNGYATESWVNGKGYSKVQVQQNYSDEQARTQIATITIDDSSTPIYAPTAGASVQPGNGRITVTQGGTEVTSFTANQSNDLTVALAAGGTPPDTYKTYSATVTSLTANDGFKTYAQTSAQLSNNGYATQKWVQDQGYSTGSANGASLSDITATIIKFEDESISSFGWKGSLTYQNFIDIGSKTAYDEITTDPQKRPVTVRIGTDITNIDNNVFNGLQSLKNVIIPDSVINIGYQAFSSCNRLSNIVIPSSVKNIGNYAFNACQKFTDIFIPANGISVGEYAFSQCYSLSNAIIAGNAYIGMHAFSNCTNLTGITIGPNTTFQRRQNQSDAFTFCGNLAKIIVEGKTQAEAEEMLSNTAIPDGCQIKTWSFPESTDLSSDIAFGVQKLPTGNAIAQYMQIATIPALFYDLVTGKDLISSFAPASNVTGAGVDVKIFIAPADGWYFVSASDTSATKLRLKVEIDINFYPSYSYEYFTIFDNEATIKDSGYDYGIRIQTWPIFLKQNMQLRIRAKTSNTTVIMSQVCRLKF